MVPALVTLAVKLTVLPLQTVVSSVVMITEGVRFGFTVIRIEFEVTVAGLTQLALEVISRLITSLFTNVLSMKILELDPMFPPFFFH